jgi:hypothetical protein
VEATPIQRGGQLSPTRTDAIAFDQPATAPRFYQPAGIILDNRNRN